MLPTYVGGKAAEYEIDWTYINNAGWHHYRRPISVDLVAPMIQTERLSPFTSPLKHNQDQML